MSTFHLEKQECITENPVYTYLSGTCQKDLPSTGEQLSGIFPHGSTAFLTTILHCEVCFLWPDKYF